MVFVKVKHFYIKIYSKLVGSRKKFRFSEYFVIPAFVKTTFHCTREVRLGHHLPESIRDKMNIQYFRQGNDNTFSRCVAELTASGSIIRTVWTNSIIQLKVS
jgi:hypothetical protein